MKLASLVAAVTATLAFSLGLGAGRATADKPLDIKDPALAYAVAAKVYDSQSQEMGANLVTCKVYTNDAAAMNGTALPKAGGRFVQACMAEPVEK